MCLGDDHRGHNRVDQDNASLRLKFLLEHDFAVDDRIQDLGLENIFGFDPEKVAVKDRYVRQLSRF
jgi:hypothetical protein